MKIIKFDTIDSTNTWALSNFTKLEDCSVIIADCQTAGRGRFDRVWVSENYDNVYLSFVLKPEKKDCVVNLTQYLCVVTANLIDEYGIKSQIKWPNDVLIGNKKVCGILCESYFKQNKMHGVVLGIGVNLNMPKEIIDSIDRPATSLNLVTGESIDKEFFINTLIERFFENYEQFIKKGFISIKPQYMEKIEFLGKEIFIQQRDGAPKVKYTAKDIDDDGNLIAENLKGVSEKILSGDVIF